MHTPTRSFTLTACAHVHSHGHIDPQGALPYHMSSMMSEIGSSPLDTIVFASPSPRHNVSLVNASIERQPGVPDDETLALILDPKHGGRVTAELIVSPSEQTYITVKFWGGENRSSFFASPCMVLVELAWLTVRRAQGCSLVVVVFS